MRVLLSTRGSRGDVEPLAGLAVRLRDFGEEVRLCAPPDDEFVALLASVGMPLVPLGPTVRSMVAGARPSSAEDAFQLAAELVAARFDALPAAAEECDVLMSAGARSAPGKLDICYVFVCFQVFGLPSPYFPPGARPGKQSRREETDLKALWEQDAQRVGALYGEAENRHRAAIGWPPVDNVSDYVFTDQPWPAADPLLCPGEDRTYLEVVQTGAWILPDERPLPDEEAFLAAVVHHGGAGTTTTVARAGAPQVVVPQIADQPYWAARVAEPGIGAAHDGPRPTVESLSAALKPALTSRTRARARTAAAKIRIDGTTVAAKLVLDTVRPGKKAQRCSRKPVIGYGDESGRRPAITKVKDQGSRHVRMSGTDAAQRTAREQEDSPQAVRAAWQSLRRAGLIAPELPSILFVAVASCAGLWWGLGMGALAAAVVLAARLRRALPIRAVLGGTIGLAVAATIAYQTGVAASGLLADICIDLALAVVLAGSIAMRRPLLGVLWSLVRREPLLRQAERFARRGYNLTTGIAAVALAVRSLALGIVYFGHEPVVWLLGVKLALGLPVTLVVVAAAYAASGLDGHDRATDTRTGQTEGA